MNTRTLIVAGVLGGLSARVSAQTYIVEDLGTLTGPSAAYALNAAGYAAGFAQGAGNEFVAFLWDGAMHTYGPVAADTQSHALGINSADQVVAVSFRIGVPGTHAILVSGGSGADLGPFAPRGINAAGVIVGSREAVLPDGWRTEEAVVWQAGQTTVLPTLGGEFASAYAINDSGWIAGSSFTPTGARPRACLWIGGVASDLGTLGGASAQALAISNSGYVVGVADTAAARPHAFRYTLGPTGLVTVRTDLGVLAGESSYAYGVNTSGDVVGVSDGRAFLWRSGTLVDLNSRIAPGAWRLDVAADINDEGRIVGWGTFGGFPRAFRLTPETCYPDCNADGALTVADFGCFQTKFVLADPYADCNADGSLTVADFGCFQTRFVVGCP